MAHRIVHGTGPVQELLQKKRDIALVYLDRKRSKKQRDPVSNIARTARQRGVTVEFTTRAHLDALAGTDRHQGAVAVTGEFKYVELYDVLARIGRRAADEPALLVALDGVQDPRNLGAIIRSAYMLGADALIVPRDRAAGVTAVTAKTSAGATEHLPVCQVTNLPRALGEIGEAGVWKAAVAAGPDTRPMASIDASLPLCLVLGSEGSGIRRLVARACDFQVEIPMAGLGVGSLNVSVAAGIALYEVDRQRRARLADAGTAQETAS